MCERDARFEVGDGVARQSARVIEVTEPFKLKPAREVTRADISELARRAGGLLDTSHGGKDQTLEREAQRSEEWLSRLVRGVTCFSRQVKRRPEISEHALGLAQQER